MKRRIMQVLLVLATMGAAAMAHGQNQSSIAQAASGQGSTNAARFSSSAVRILRPSPGQTLANNFVTIRFELVRPNSAGSDHNFVIQLDGNDPVNTSETEYTFPIIRPGNIPSLLRRWTPTERRCRMPGRRYSSPSNYRRVP